MTTPRTTPLRKSDRLSTDRALAHEILDEAFLCHLAVVVDGEPRVLPMLHVRVGDTVYVHGSTGGRFGLNPGARLCLSATLLDGLVLAKSQFSHSANYRSVVVHGAARKVTDPVERDTALAAFMEKVVPGRGADSRPPNAKELAQTVLLALPLDEFTAKARTGGPNDDPADLDLPHWAGVIPLAVTLGRPQASAAGPLPDYLAADPWRTPAVLVGEHVRLEPLHPSHAAELFANTRDPEIWTHLGHTQPADVAEMAAIVDGALADPERVAWAQLDARTGEVLGTTSYYEIDPVKGGLGIGYTFIGKAWWRTGVNTESKLLLLTRAFDVLGANRVTWHTDNRNLRSQAAIERLGATREGVLRHHRFRADGTLRDTHVFGMTAPEWPSARARLAARLATEG